MGFITPLITIATGVMGFLQARSQNKAIEASMEAQNEATAARQQQLADQNAVARHNRLREASQAEGRIRALSAESGLSGRSFEAIAFQNQFESQFDQQTLLNNLGNDFGLAQSQNRAAQAQLASQGRSPLLSGISSGLQGASVGLQIDDAIQRRQLLGQQQGRLTTATRELGKL